MGTNLQCGKANSLPPWSFFEKWPYNKLITRIIKFDVMRIYRVLEATLFKKNTVTVFIITPKGAFQNLHFRADKINDITSHIMEAIILRKLDLLYKIDPTKC